MRAGLKSGKRPFRVTGVSTRRGGFRDAYVLSTFSTIGAATTAAVRAIAAFRPHQANTTWRQWHWEEVVISGVGRPRIYVRNDDQTEYLVYEQPPPKKETREGVVTIVGVERELVGRGTLFPTEQR